MLKQLRVIVLLLVCTQAGFSQLSGALSGVLGPGTYHVVDTISVESGSSLQLMPSTTFIFDEPYPFYVEGTLLAEGTESDSIVFTSDTIANPGRWRGLRFSNTTRSQNKLSYCVLENGFATGSDHERSGGGAYFNYALADLSHCVFRNNEAEIWG